MAEILKNCTKVWRRISAYSATAYQRLRHWVEEGYHYLYERHKTSGRDGRDVGPLIQEFTSLHETLKPYRIPTLILCLGLVLSIAGFVATLQRNTEERVQEFYNYTNTQETAAIQLFNNYLDNMKLSQYFFKISSWVTKEEFATFINPLKKRGNFSFFTRISYDADKEELSILQAHTVDATLQDADIRDLLKEPKVISGLRAAKKRGSITATDVFSLNEGDEYNLGIIFPYYKFSLGQRAATDGFVLGALNLKAIFSGALDWENKRQKIATYIFNDSDSIGTPIYVSNARNVTFRPRLSEGPTLEMVKRRSPFYHQTTINLANKKWQVLFVPTDDYLANAPNIFPWLVLAGGVIITALISVFTFYLTTRHLEVSRIVEERTGDLEKAMRRLTRTNYELERFAYVASHDLKEPLRLVSNFTNILYEEYRGKLGKNGKEYVDIIVSETDNMQNLVKGLLEYAQIDQLKEMPKKPANCQELLERVLKNLRMRIKETGATITHDKMPTVMGYTIPIAQLFQNLIGNALKYCQGHPPVIHIGCKNIEDYWLFSVKDNGIGIQKEYFDRIFEPFKRLHRKDQFEGSGIGLAICKKTVDYLNGKIWVESTYGRGSTFYFTIPKKGAEETSYESNT